MPVQTRRFKKLVDDYRLDLAPNGSVPSLAKELLNKSSEIESSDRREYEGPGGEMHETDSSTVKKEARLVIEPRWMLWSTSADCS